MATWTPGSASDDCRRRRLTAGASERRHGRDRSAARLKPPGAILSDGSLALLGTDQVGRDLLAQVLQGARISLLVAAGTIIAAGLIGMTIGVLAGYYGGVLDMGA